ncbi:GntR family transcriptional regulator [Streptomyces cadmiisoli]|uniref:GntR family transcriptional regulator n=1 Tax=Streptomyces cadmiisoli TaxID=2184053 RepID=UPI001FEA2194|nr:GntR family transcriptional regulator [Streptomyces cadmiisoli]
MDLDRSVPVWPQVADELRRRLDAGRYPVGERFPGTVDIAAEFDVSQSTAQKAVAALSLAVSLRVAELVWWRSTDDFGRWSAGEYGEGPTLGPGSPRSFGSWAVWGLLVSRRDGAVRRGGGKPWRVRVSTARSPISAGVVAGRRG